MKKQVSSIAYCLLSVCVFLVNPYRSSATHLVAADMTYKWISGNTYKITIVLYGDCGAASAGAFAGLPISAPQVCIYNGTTYINSISLAIQAPICGKEITPVICPGTVSQCTDPASTEPGIKQFVYTGTVDLFGISNAWRFVYDGAGGGATGTVSCNGADMTTTAPTAGRGAPITNILNAGNSIIQLIDTLDNTHGHNSSPVLTILPTPYYCVNSDNCYYPGAVDRYDSTIGLTSCGGAGGEVVYTGTAWSYPSVQLVTGYTPLQVDSASQFNLNPATGQVCFTPSLLQRSDVVYNIREYRNGVFIGSCQREMTFLVQTCTSTILAASYATATLGTIKDSSDFQICSGIGNFSMIMNPTDDDSKASITVTAGVLPPGATFTVTGNTSPFPHCVFSWTTVGVDTGKYSYSVTFADDHCPYAGKLIRTFNIFVTAPLAITPTIKNDICNTGKGSITTTVNGGVAPYTYQWSDGVATSSATGLLAGTYTVSVVDIGTCKNSLAITVENDSVTLAITPTIKNDICKTSNGSIEIAANGGLAPYIYKWSVDSAGKSISALGAGAYSVLVTDLNGCKNSFSLNVEEDICPEIIVHDVITPNGDGFNDVWVIEGIQNYPKSAVQVFDKWGDKLYEQSGYNNNWAGRGSKGELLPDGTYFYIVKLNAPNAAGGQNQFKGSLLIKR
jgi:gliding motility-associated-like protein